MTLRDAGRSARCAVLLLMLVIVSCSRGGWADAASDTGFVIGAGESGSTLPPVLLDALSTDEDLLRCWLDESSGQVRIEAGSLRVHRVDVDADGKLDWIVSGSGNCLVRDDQAPWWLLRATSADAQRGDGPSLLLRERSSRLRLLESRHGGFHDLVLEPGDRRFIFDGRRYVGPAAVPATAGGSTPTPTQSTLIDMRTAVLPPVPQMSATERERVFGFADLGGEATINSVVSGRFLPGGEQTAYVVQRGGPRAADPQAPLATLLIVQDGRLEARVDKLPGNFLVGVADVDGDGVQEMLLRRDAYQMGQSLTGLNLVALDGQALKSMADFKEAASDACEGPPLTRERTAVAIDVRRGEAGPVFNVRRYRADCKAGAEFQPLEP